MPELVNVLESEGKEEGERREEGGDKEEGKSCAFKRTLR